MEQPIKWLFSHRIFAKKTEEANKTWYYKTLYSYVPVFFFVSSLLFLILFLAFSEHIKKTTLKSNEIFIRQISQSINNILSPIDKMVVKEMMTNNTLNTSFYSQNLGAYDTYQVSLLFKNLIMNFPIIDSAYLFRQKDHLVISESIFTSLDQFSDKQFVLQQLSLSKSASWTGKRMYTNVRKQEAQPVISLVKKYPFHTGDLGLVVINIRVDTIRNHIKEMSNFETGYIRLFDQKGSLILSTQKTIPRELHVSTMETSLSHTKSAYTGWEIHSGFDNGTVFSFFSVFPYFWVALGLVCIVAGMIWMIYITRRNYKPIETIMKRIHGSFVHKNSELFNKTGNPDEIRFIELAIENLMEQTNKFRNQYEEDLIRIRHNFFKEIVEGNRPMDDEEWKYEMQRLGFCTEFKKIAFCVLEIDKYYEFRTNYSDKDQYLLKFVLSSVLHEIAQTHKIFAWTEWISNEHFGILYTVEDSNRDILRIVQHIADTVIAWIQENLNFTVTVGIGGETDKFNEIPDLYANALEALKYKPVLGNHRVINHWELLLEPKMQILNYVQFISTIAHSFRSGDPAWDSQYKEFLQDLKRGMLPREDILSLIHYLIYYLDRNINELPNKLQTVWQKDTMLLLTDIHTHFETLDEFEKQSYPVLRKIMDEILFFRENQVNNQLIHDVRQYIQDHYSNPELSLNHLSDVFNLSPSYLSQLFKEAFGEKFIDYLVEIRIEAAKGHLLKTNESVQSIALQIGYLHSFSFIRAFKKLVGKTPGEFRKN
jgi:two-component system response regulator YesN